MTIGTVILVMVMIQLVAGAAINQNRVIVDNIAEASINAIMNSGVHQARHQAIKYATTRALLHKYPTLTAQILLATSLQALVEEVAMPTGIHQFAKMAHTSAHALTRPKNLLVAAAPQKIPFAAQHAAEDNAHH